MSELNSLGITEKQWEMIQDVSLELNCYKRIVAGAGQGPLNIIATSTCLLSVGEFS